jgi:hypothetical protein
MLRCRWCTFCAPLVYLVHVQRTRDISVSWTTIDKKRDMSCVLLCIRSDHASSHWPHIDSNRTGLICTYVITDMLIKRNIELVESWTRFVSRAYRKEVTMSYRLIFWIRSKQLENQDKWMCLLLEISSDRDEISSMIISCCLSSHSSNKVGNTTVKWANVNVQR